LEKRAEQVLPGIEGDGRVGAGGEMAQTMYADMNKQINKKSCNFSVL
jgi:hypothetical protein